jgi:dihydrofolate synthase/folylpolyglutamate synthase
VGTAQAGNAAVAIAMLNAAGSRWSVSLDDAAGILPSVTLPGRFQRLGNMILDVAHNADGIRGVVDTLERVEHEPPVVALLGVLADKDWRAMLTELSRVAARVILVSPPSAPANRAWDPQEAKAFALDRGIHASVETDFALAIRDARATHGTVLVTGSFHTVGDALAEMGEKTL